MRKLLPPIGLGREEAAEILNMIDPITTALGSAPYVVAQPAIDLIDAIREHICEATPGGYAGQCESCGLPTGHDEAGQYTEDGVVWCLVCRPADHPTEAEIEAGDVDAVDRARAAADGWVEWKGGECPLHPDALVEVRLRNESEPEPDTVSSWRWSYDTDPLEADSDIVAYRLVKPARAVKELADFEHPRVVPPAANQRDAGGLGEGATMADRRVPRFADRVVDWSNHADAAQAVKDGKLPEGFSIAGDGALLVPDHCSDKREGFRGYSTVVHSFREVRSASGEVLKTANPNWAPPEFEELQLLRQLLKADGRIKTSHSATKATADRLDKSADVLIYLTAGPNAIGSGLTIAVELTAKGKRRLDAVGGAE